MQNRIFGDIQKELAEFSNSKICLQSIPYDGTSTWGKGADKGFVAFLEAARNMELYDIETDSEVYKHGICILDELNGFGSPEEMFQNVYTRTKELISYRKFLTFFGGEHSISIGIMKAFYEYYSNLTILQIDAHADLRPIYKGSPYNHACALYDVSKNANLIQVGIRSMDIEEKQYLNSDQVYFAHDLNSADNSWMAKSIDQMTDQVYITFDLDALDPSIMPATGTPEPGGLDWNTSCQYLKEVFKNKEVVGFDMVEFAPIDGLHHPQFLAAKLYYKMLSYKFHYAK